MTNKINCRDCYYCIPAAHNDGRDWCRMHEAYQEPDKHKTRCKDYDTTPRRPLL